MLCGFSLSDQSILEIHICVLVMTSLLDLFYFAHRGIDFYTNNILYPGCLLKKKSIKFLTS